MHGYYLVGSHKVKIINSRHIYHFHSRFEISSLFSVGVSDSMERNSSWEPKSGSAKQIYRLVRNWKVHYSIHKSLLLDLILNHMNPVQMLTLFFSRSILILSPIYFNLNAGNFPSLNSWQRLKYRFTRTCYMHHTTDKSNALCWWRAKATAQSRSASSFSNLG